MLAHYAGPHRRRLLRGKDSDDYARDDCVDSRKQALMSASDSWITGLSSDERTEEESASKIDVRKL